MPSGNRSIRRYTIAVGLLVAGIGVAVQVGWLLEQGVLTQLHPDFPAMTFNTAFGLVLCGAGLVAAARRWRTGMRVFAWTTVVLGGLTLLEYLSGVNLGIDELFVRDPYQFKTAFPGRMSPTTAIAFVASGGVLLSLARRREVATGPRAWPSAAVYWLLLTVTIAMLRYASGIERLFAWPVLESMALHTAACFLFVTSSLAVELRQRKWLWRPWGDDQHGRRIVVTSSALLMVVILFVGSLALRSVTAAAWRFTEEAFTADARARAAALSLQVSEIKGLLRVAARDERLLRPLARRADGASSSSADTADAEVSLGEIVAENDQIVAAALLNDAGELVLPSDPATPWPALAAKDSARARVGAKTILAAPRREAGEIRAEVVTPLLRNGRRLGFLALRIRHVKLVAVVTEPNGPGNDREVMLGRRVGSELEFLLPGRGDRAPEAVSWASERAEPMRRALSGESGFIEAPDYHGVRVAAAFLPVPGTDWGLVVKTDVAGLLVPFRRAATALLAGTPVAAAIGTLLLWLVVGPLVRRLADRERFAGAIVESVPVGLFIADGSELTYVNPFLCRLTEQPPEGLLGRAWEQTGGSFDGQRFIDSTKRILTEAKSFSSEVAVSNLGGNPRWVHVGGVPFGETGRPRQVLGFCVDITRRKRAEELLDREHEAATAISTATFRYLETGDLNEMVQSILGCCTRLTGASFGCISMTDPAGELDLIGATDLVWAGTNAKVLAAAARQEFEGRGSAEEPSFELSLPRATGPPRGSIPDEVKTDSQGRGTPETRREPVSILGVPLRAGKEIVGYICLANRKGGFREEERAEIERFAPTAAFAITRARDQQERQLLVEQLVRSQKMEVVGRLAGGVAHDFNNILTVISTNTDMLCADASISPPQRHLAEAIGQAGDRAALLTRQLLAFARRQVLEPRVLDLNAIVGDLVEMLRRLIGEDIELVLSLAPELSRVRVDLGQIEQVIANFAVNARDAMPNGGRLALGTRLETITADDAKRNPAVGPGRYVVLEISDTGIGMTEEVKAHLFEPFFTTKGDMGTGLGLATALGIVEQHAGTIRLDSGEGRGTVFTIYLPATEAEAEAPAPQFGSDAVSHGSEVILVVEDDARVRKGACEALTCMGYRVLGAALPSEALEIAAADRGAIDLLVTDVVMPEMSGIDLAQRIREILPQMRVLFTSGYAADFIGRHRALDDDAAFLQKPYGLASLAQKVRHELDGPETESRTRKKQPDDFEPDNRV